MRGNKNIGAVVLGFNDAIVELTGALAGLTFAFQNSRLIATAAGITGIAASLSMAASVYLAAIEEGRKEPLQSGLYTGAAYLITVIFLILPYLLLNDPIISLALTLLIALGIIFLFNFYSTQRRGDSLKKNFLRMAAISLGVALINFLIGSLIRTYFHIGI